MDTSFMSTRALRGRVETLARQRKAALTQLAKARSKIGDLRIEVRKLKAELVKYKGVEYKPTDAEIALAWAKFWRDYPHPIGRSDDD